jgi:hypothetical protein
MYGVSDHSKIEVERWKEVAARERQMLVECRRARGHAMFFAYVVGLVMGGLMGWMLC